MKKFKFSMDIEAKDVKAAKKKFEETICHSCLEDGNAFQDVFDVEENIEPKFSVIEVVDGRVLGVLGVYKTKKAAELIAKLARGKKLVGKGIIVVEMR